MLKKVGNHFLYLNKSIKEINVPSYNLRALWFKILNDYQKNNPSNRR